MVITCFQEALQLELLFSLVVDLHAKVSLHLFLFPRLLFKKRENILTLLFICLLFCFKDLPFVSFCYSSSFVKSLTNLLTFVSSVMGFYISQPTTDPPGDYFATARTLVGEYLRTFCGLLGGYLLLINCFTCSSA